MSPQLKVAPYTTNSASLSNTLDKVSNSTSSIYPTLIDGANPGSSSYLDQFSFYYGGKERKNHSNENYKEQSRFQHYGILNAPNEVFVAIMTLGSSAFSPTITTSVSSNLNTSDIKKIMEVYEFNCETLSKVTTIRGGVISITL